MSEEVEKQPINYIELTLKQVETVQHAADRLRASASEESNRQLEIELEKLCFYQNSAKEKPKIRAQQATERVRAIVLGRAITQRLPKPKYRG